MPIMALHSGQAAFIRQATDLSEKIEDILVGGNSAVALAAMAVLMLTQLEDENDRYPSDGLIMELRTLIASLAISAPRVN